MLLAATWLIRLIVKQMFFHLVRSQDVPQIVQSNIDNQPSRAPSTSSWPECYKTRAHTGNFLNDIDAGVANLKPQ